MDQTTQLLLAFLIIGAGHVIVFLLVAWFVCAVVRTLTRTVKDEWDRKP